MAYLYSEREDRYLRFDIISDMGKAERIRELLNFSGYPFQHYCPWRDRMCWLLAQAPTGELWEIGFLLSWLPQTVSPSVPIR